MSRLTCCWLTAVALLIAGCGSSASNPAATVNGHDISMADFSKQVTYNCLQESANLQGFNPCDQKKDTSGLAHRIRASALDTLINEELVREYARSHGISVPTDTFNATWKNVFDTKFRRNMPALKAYAKSNGMTVADVKGMVYFDMLQQRVLYAVTSNRSISVPATRLAQVVLGNLQEADLVRSDLHKGYSFASIARSFAARHKSACQQTGCGELGWLPNAFLPAPERPVASARVGSLEGPYYMQNGLTMVYVEQHLPNYRLTPSQQFAMRQQVWFPEWIARLKQRASVHRYATT